MKFLVVEDEPISAKVLQALLSEYAECTWAKNGQEAYDHYCDAYEAGENFDIIFMDIMMPEVGGQEALAAIREFEGENGVDLSSGVKVVMTTTLEDAQNIYEAHSNGCVDYLVKPVQRKNLTKCLKKIGISQVTH